MIFFESVCGTHVLYALEIVSLALGSIERAIVAIYPNVSNWKLSIETNEIECIGPSKGRQTRKRWSPLFLTRNSQVDLFLPEKCKKEVVGGRELESVRVCVRVCVCLFEPKMSIFGKMCVNVQGRCFTLRKTNQLIIT
jgi:hypothetical protein